MAKQSESKDPSGRGAQGQGKPFAAEFQPLQTAKIDLKALPSTRLHASLEGKDVRPFGADKVVLDGKIDYLARPDLRKSAR